MSKKFEIESKIVSEYNEPDILFFTETWINENININELYIPGYQEPILNNRPRGGAAAYIKNNIKFEQLTISSPSQDTIWIVIKTKNNKSRIYGCIYRPPSSTDDNNNRLIQNIKDICSKYDEVILIGDFNLPTINWHLENCTGIYPNIFLENIRGCHLEQLITEKTRYRHGQNPSTLDLLFASNPSLIENIKHLPPLGKSDHDVISFNVLNSYIKKHQKHINTIFKKPTMNY